MTVVGRDRVRQAGEGETGPAAERTGPGVATVGRAGEMQDGAAELAKEPAVKQMPADDPQLARTVGDDGRMRAEILDERLAAGFAKDQGTISCQRPCVK